MARKTKTTSEPETVSAATQPTPEPADPAPKKRGRKPTVIAADCGGGSEPSGCGDRAACHARAPAGAQEAQGAASNRYDQRGQARCRDARHRS